MGWGEALFACSITAVPSSSPDSSRAHNARPGGPIYTSAAAAAAAPLPPLLAKPSKDGFLPFSDQPGGGGGGRHAAAAAPPPASSSCRHRHRRPQPGRLQAPQSTSWDKPYYLARDVRSAPRREFLPGRGGRPRGPRTVLHGSPGV